MRLVHARSARRSKREPIERVVDRSAPDEIFESRKVNRDGFGVVVVQVVRRRKRQGERPRVQRRWCRHVDVHRLRFRYLDGCWLGCFRCCSVEVGEQRLEEVVKSPCLECGTERSERLWVGQEGCQIRY